MNILNSFCGKTVLITGDTGFKGAWLSFWLATMGANVIGYSLPNMKKDALFSLLNLNEIINHIDGDLENEDMLYKVFHNYKPDYVFHLAAQSLVNISYQNPRLTFNTNFNGSLNLLECIRKTDFVRSLVFVTSDKCYKNKEWIWGYRENDELGGQDPYRASKAAAEILFECYLNSFFYFKKSLGSASVRTGNVIGGGDWAQDRIVPDCIRSLISQSEIRLRNPDAIRPWQHILDLLYGYLLLANSLYNSPEQFSGSWNFGPSYLDSITVKELATKIISSWDSNRKTDIKIIESSPNMYESSCLRVNSDKANIKLGWSPKWNAERTIKETVYWYKQVWEGSSPKDVTYKQIADYMSKKHK
jgi:CDP-glucose 4,6-dehydratase